MIYTSKRRRHPLPVHNGVSPPPHRSIQKPPESYLKFILLCDSSKRGKPFDFSGGRGLKDCLKKFLQPLKQRKKLCSVVSQSIFLQYFQNDHCIKQKMVTTLYIFKICVNSEWHFQDYGIVKYHWLRWLSKNNICEICSCAHPLNSPVGMHVFSHL